MRIIKKKEIYVKSCSKNSKKYVIMQQILKEEEKYNEKWDN
jgi:hypothetical protein